MVEPRQFGFNLETAATNSMARNSLGLTRDTIRTRALLEFQELVARLREQGVEVLAVDGNHSAETPDAVFPNNWFSIHETGELVLYPMAVPSRRAERRPDVIKLLKAKFPIQRVLDLTTYEEQGLYLEGTGVLVLDRVHRVAYAGLSSRAHAEPFAHWARQLGYRAVPFTTADLEGREIYHTNVMMSVGRNLAVVCLEAIPSHLEREAVVKSLNETGHRILEISWEQAKHFCGNVLELGVGPEQFPLWAMSESAHVHFTPSQREEFRRDRGKIVSSSIPCIEQLGGGSVRCMIAEIFL